AVQPGRGDQIAADDEEDRHRERPAVFVAGQQLDRLLGSAPGQRIAVDQQHQRSREETQEIEIVFPGVQRSVEMHCALRNGLFSRDCWSYWVKASFGPVCKRSAFPTGGRFVLSLRCLSRRGFGRRTTRVGSCSRGWSFCYTARLTSIWRWAMPRPPPRGRGTASTPHSRFAPTRSEAHADGWEQEVRPTRAT